MPTVTTSPTPPVLAIGGGSAYANYANGGKGPVFVIQPGEGGWMTTNGTPYWVEALMPGYDMQVNHDLMYHFATALPSYSADGPILSTLQPFTDPRYFSLMRDAMAKVSTLIDVRYTETNDPNQPATMNIVPTDFGGGGADGAMPPYAGFLANLVSYDIRIDNTSTASFDLRKLLFEGTFVHELGHTLGLSHPHDLSSVAMPLAEDNGLYSIESYKAIRVPGVEGTLPGPTEFQVLDIAALQYLYGPSKTVRTGDDTYALSADSANFLWDAVGSNTVDGSALNAPITLSLRPGYWGYVGTERGTGITAPGQITVNYNSFIDGAIGTRFDDRLYGNERANAITGGAGNDVFWGYEGNDTIDGGQGIDLAGYDRPMASYTLSKGIGTFTVTDTTPGASSQGLDTLTGVERLRFTDTSLAIDFEAGQSGNLAARLLGTVLGKTGPFADWVHNKPLIGAALSLFDSGMTTLDVATFLVDSGIFASVIGSSTQHVTVENGTVDVALGSDTGDLNALASLYLNVTGHKGDLLTLKALLPEIQQKGQAWLISSYASLDSTAEQINLVGLQQTGVEFV